MHLVGFIIRKFVTMHGHVNVKYPTSVDFRITGVHMSLSSLDVMTLSTLALPSVCEFSKK
jgi:hypothetical protein